MRCRVRTRHPPVTLVSKPDKVLTFRGRRYGRKFTSHMNFVPSSIGGAMLRGSHDARAGSCRGRIPTEAHFYSRAAEDRAADVDGAVVQLDCFLDDREA